MGTIDKFRGFMGDLLHNGKMYPPIGSDFISLAGSSILVVIKQAYNLTSSRFSAFPYNLFSIIGYVFHPISGIYSNRHSG